MEKVLPWEEMIAIIAPHYPKGEKGRPPIRLETMLRIHFLQQWHGYSDSAMEDVLYDSVAARTFARVASDHVPGLFCKLRHLLERHALGKQLFEASREHLAQNGPLVKTGTIVDAALIAEPSWTKNKARQRDPEMKSTKNGNTWHFGIKAPVGTDTQRLVHSVAVTAANVHDSRMMAECLRGEEDVAYGEKEYVSEKRKVAAEEIGVEWRALRKATNKRMLNCVDPSFNKESNRTRAKVAHAIGVIKNLWGYRKTRYPGLKKNTGQVYTLMALASIYMARKSLVALQG